jgi:uncharacterized membrane protein YadS
MRRWVLGILAGFTGAALATAFGLPWWSALLMGVGFSMLANAAVDAAERY